ncbi:MAG: MFS transporter [Mesorhizobium sp.]|nr:MAG: MFS transporter [Mesorhizobium sp.]
MLGARFLDRIGAGTRSAPRDALIAAAAPEEHRGKAFGLEGIGDNLGAFLGPLIAVFLLGALRLDMRGIFYLTIIPGLLALAMVLFVHEERTDFVAKAKVEMSLRGFSRTYWKYLLALAADLVPKELRAGGIGWYNSLVGMIQLLASVVAGLLWD